MSGNDATPVTTDEAKPAASLVPEFLPPGTDLVLSRHDVPARLADQLALAEAMYRSNMVPAPCRSLAGMMAAMRAAMALQVPLWHVMQNIHPIDGKISYDATFIRALVLRAGHKIRTVVRDHDRAVVRITRYDDPEPYEVEFTWEDAQIAGLDGKNNWQQHGKAMLVARATQIAVREFCPDILFGAGYSPDELGAVTDAEGTPMMTVPAERGPVPTEAHPVKPSAEDVEAIKARWREDIAAAADLEAVDALYQRAKAQSILSAPLYDNGTTVEGALANAAAQLRADANGIPDADDDVHDADVVQDDTPAAAPAEAAEDEPAPDPDPPHACRDSARRRGVLKLLSEGGDVNALTLGEFGLPLGQVATDRLVKLHLRISKESK